MGFSWAGLVLSLAVLGPNLLLLRFPPRSPVPAVRVPWAVGWLERAGQALCLVVPAITAPGTFVPGWAAPVAAGLGGYYALWGRYLRHGCAGAALYQPLWGIPVPMAVLPVVVFLAAAGLLSNPWIAVAAVVLGAGHVPVSLLTARSVGAGRSGAAGSTRARSID